MARQIPKDQDIKISSLAYGRYPLAKDKKKNPSQNLKDKVSHQIAAARIVGKESKQLIRAPHPQECKAQRVLTREKFTDSQTFLRVQNEAHIHIFSLRYLVTPRW